MKDYRFFQEGKEKDPIIHLIMTELQKQGRLNNAGLEIVAAKAGCASSTLRNWFFGDTRRPHFLIVRFVLEAVACKLQVVRDDGTIVRGPREK